ncbi:uncharacterized protein [Ptychodera flava]|uniref:uncharacterized protein n=1 Tax=Ptychodera flava TaxID=63121 RepID=UPI00396AADB7
MDKTFNQPREKAYMDDLGPHDHSWEDHVKHLRSIFERLRSCKLTARPTKCYLGGSEVSFIGYGAGSGKIKPMADKVNAVVDYPTPVTKRDVRSFLGLAGYYRKFIPNFSDIATPLTELTCKNSPANVQWTQSCVDAFQKLKDALASSPVLAVPDYNKPFVVQTDASDHGIGAVLCQYDDKGEEHPVQYISRKTPPQGEKLPNYRKRVFSHCLGCGSFESLLVRERVYSSNRSQSISLVRQNV